VYTSLPTGHCQFNQTVRLRAPTQLIGSGSETLISVTAKAAIGFWMADTDDPTAKQWIRSVTLDAGNHEIIDSWQPSARSRN
jgi:hypothetical protein